MAVASSQPSEQSFLNLNSLFPEIIDQILFSLDSRCTLRNFIFTSRYIHQRFLTHRNLFILRVLKNEIGPVLADAAFLARFPCADPGKTFPERVIYWYGIHSMSAQYKEILSEGIASIAKTHPLSYTEVTQICNTVNKLNFIVDVYLKVQLQLFEIEGAASAKPSREERLRVLRAFCRRQILCNAWAATKRQQYQNKPVNYDIRAIGNTNDSEGERLGLMDAFEPWELQQIDHIEDFASRFCVALFSTGALEAQPMSRETLGDIFTSIDHLVNYMQQHTNVAEIVISKWTSLGSFNCMAWGPVVAKYSLFCLTEFGQEVRRDMYPDPERDQPTPQWKDSKGPKVNFIEEAVDLPSFGWVDALDGCYTNWFGAALRNATLGTPVENEALESYDAVMQWRRLGFALWDQKRVAALKEAYRYDGFKTGWVFTEI